MRSVPPPNESAERQTGPALEACYRWLLWLIPAVEKFPRSQKFLLGDKLQTKSHAVLEHLVVATYQPEQRAKALLQANVALEHLRFLVRLAHDLHHFDMPRYAHAARSIDEIGRLVGGWAKHTGATHAGVADASQAHPVV